LRGAAEESVESRVIRVINGFPRLKRNGFGGGRITDATGATDRKPAPVSVMARDLFWEFLKIGLSGFGGVLPFAHRILVERSHWLTEQEFAEVLSLAQFLPGPNIVNLSVIVGRRFQGPMGAVAASLGLMLLPLVIILLLAVLYAEFAQIHAVRNACYGVSASASGLILAVALKMAQPIRRAPWKIGIGAIAFVAIGPARLPLLWVLAVLAPLSIAIAFRRRW
jgi:chromate transporter